MREKFKQLGRESFIYGMSGMLQKFMAVLLVPLYTKVFLPHEYGQQGLVVTVITLVAALAVLGMDSAAHTWFWRMEDESERRKPVATWFWCQIAVSSVLGIAVAVFAPAISFAISGSESSTLLLRLAAATLPLGVAGAVLTNYFRLQRRAAATLWFTAASGIGLVALNFVFVLILKWGLPGFFLAQIVAGGVITAMAVWLMRRTIHPRDASVAQLRAMLPFALPLVPAALAFWVMGLSDRLFIEKYLNTHEVGLYQFGAGLAAVVTLLTGAFTTAWGPFALSIQRQSDAPAIYARGLLVYLAFGGAMVAGVCLFTTDAVLLLAREEYLDAVPVVGILSLGVLANGLATIAATGLNLAQRSAPIAGAVFVAAGVSVLLNMLLIPVFGKTGSAWASAAAWIVYAGFIFLRAQRIYPLPYDLRRAAIVGVLLVGTAAAAPMIHVGPRPVDVLLRIGTGMAILWVLFTVALPGWTGMLRRTFRPAGGAQPAP